MEEEETEPVLTTDFNVTALDPENLCEEERHPRWFQVAQPSNYPAVSLRSGLPLVRKELLSDFRRGTVVENELSHFINWDWIDRIEKRTQKNPPNFDPFSPMCLCVPELRTGEFCQNHLRLDANGNIKPTWKQHVALIVSPVSKCRVRDNNGFVYDQKRYCPWALMELHAGGGLVSCFDNRFFTRIPDEAFIMKYATRTRTALRVNVERNRRCIRCDEDPLDSTFLPNSILSTWVSPQPPGVTWPRVHQNPDFYYYLDDWAIRNGDLDRNLLSELR